MKGVFSPFERGRYYDITIKNIPDKKTVESLQSLSKSRERYNIQGALRKELLTKARVLFPNRNIPGDKKTTKIFLYQSHRSKNIIPEKAIFKFRIIITEVGVSLSLFK